MQSLVAVHVSTVAIKSSPSLQAACKKIVDCTMQVYLKLLAAVSFVINVLLSLAGGWRVGWHVGSQ